MERTRRLIADKAFELFTEHGFDATTVEQIAAAAEVGPRTLYRYFPTKETLIVQFVEASLRAALDRLCAQPDDLPLPQALYAVIDSVIGTTEADAHRVMAVYEMAGRAPSVQAQLSDLTWRWRQDLAAEIARRLPGRSTQLTASLAAAITMNIIDVGVQAWVDSGGRINMRKLTTRALDMLRAGELPVPTPARKASID
jgi:AcrR family transcriptional regulator